MRDIKFRAWDKKTKKMRVVGSIAFGVLSANKEGYPVCSLLGFDCIEQKEYFIHRDSPDFILEQFTGLHDKNGKEIYEGDIIHHYLGVDVVKWDVDGFTVGDWEPRGLEDFLHTCEVIGNIHEATK